MEGRKETAAGSACGYCHLRSSQEVIHPEMLPRTGEGPQPVGDTLLATYFNEMAAIPVFKPAEELERALEIQATEEELWSRLLGYPPLLLKLCTMLEARGESALGAPLGPLRGAYLELQAGDEENARQRFMQQLKLTSRALRQADPDRETLGAVIAALQAAARGGGFPAGGPRGAHAEGEEISEVLERVTTLHDQSQAMRNHFVKANLKLVVTISRRYYFGQLSFQDLIQEGNLGLIKAVGRFDPERGYRFSTYAAWWIRHAVTRALSNKGRLVRLPVQFLGNRYKVARARRELSGQLGRPPTRDELCRCTGLEMEKVEQLQDTPSGFELSLDSTPEGDDQGRRFIDLLHDPEAASPVEEAMVSEIMGRVEHALEQLKPIEADVVRERFGLADGLGHTLEEVGRLHDLSRERIRQIQNRALQKIRLKLGFSLAG